MQDVAAAGWVSSEAASLVELAEAVAEGLTREANRLSDLSLRALTIVFFDREAMGELIDDTLEGPVELEA